MTAGRDNKHSLENADSSGVRTLTFLPNLSGGADTMPVY
jgi:hypothetical protein